MSAGVNVTEVPSIRTGSVLHSVFVRNNMRRFAARSVTYIHRHSTKSPATRYDGEHAEAKHGHESQSTGFAQEVIVYGGVTQSVSTGGLMSGHRATTFINSVRNRAYIEYADEGMKGTPAVWGVRFGGCGRL